MNRLVGLAVLLIGAVLLNFGRQSPEAVATTMSGATPAVTSRSIWLLGIGAVAAVWGLFALMRRTAL